MCRRIRQQRDYSLSASCRPPKGDAARRLRAWVARTDCFKGRDCYALPPYRCAISCSKFSSGTGWLNR